MMIFLILCQNYLKLPLNILYLTDDHCNPDNALEKIKEHLSKTVLKENKESQTNFNFD